MVGDDDFETEQKRGGVHTRASYPRRSASMLSGGRRPLQGASARSAKTVVVEKKVRRRLRTDFAPGVNNEEVPGNLTGNFADSGEEQKDPSIDSVLTHGERQARARALEQARVRQAQQTQRHTQESLEQEKEQAVEDVAQEREGSAFLNNGSPIENRMRETASAQIQSAASAVQEGKAGHGAEQDGSDTVNSPEGVQVNFADTQESASQERQDVGVQETSRGLAQRSAGSQRTSSRGGFPSSKKGMERGGTTVENTGSFAPVGGEEGAESKERRDPSRKTGPTYAVKKPSMYRKSGMRRADEEGGGEEGGSTRYGYDPLKAGEKHRFVSRSNLMRISEDDDFAGGPPRHSLASTRRRLKRKQQASSAPPPKVMREVIIPDSISVQELASRMSERAVDLIKALMKQGMIVRSADVLDSDTAQLLTEEFGHTAKRVSESDVEDNLVEPDEADAHTRERAPVVTVMGHVDHGKTSLLDALRETHVTMKEAGGITQHIGAYQINANGKHITFLDTPGHEAFTAMRERGSQVTDIVVLVVAADDGIMPQTIEAIHHAKAAQVPIVVAINKIDRPDSDPERIKRELLTHEVVLEEFGGEALGVLVSATTREGLDKLVEAILLQAEMLGLKANAKRKAVGTVIESRLDKGYGPMATILVQQGTLRVGDIIVAGMQWGRVRLLLTEQGKTVETAGPSMPVAVVGFSNMPESGDQLVVVNNEARARGVTEYRFRTGREKQISRKRASFDEAFLRLRSGSMKAFPLVVKADTRGSVEAIVQALEALGNAEVSAQIVYANVGAITQSDVRLASVSKAPVIGFNVRSMPLARALAAQTGTEVRYYSVIYNLMDDVKSVLSGLLAPEIREEILGYAEIREVFSVSNVGKVAGCLVTEGTVKRGCFVRLVRDGTVIHEGVLTSLKRFKDEVKEVQSGLECGMAFEKYQDIHQGDVVECFDKKELKRTLN